jgi:HPr kinase/phosphorylase
VSRADVHMPQTPGVAVGTLLQGRPEQTGLPLEVLAGAAGLGRLITSPHVQKTGLALAGFHEYLQPGRILVLGESEVRFLETLGAEARASAVSLALQHDLPCLLVTRGMVPPAELSQAADRAGIAVLQTALATPTAIARISAVLEDALAERVVVHGVLLDVLGLGVLIMGESGIGKSECALDLVVRGHRLVADDTVEVRRRTETVLLGTSPELTRNHMELRGLGIINVREMFGVASTRHSKRVELVVFLERWEPGRAYERLGLDDQFHEMLNVKVPCVRMPVAPGRNTANLVEVAARNQLLRARGHHAARILSDRLNQSLLDAAPQADDDGDDGPGGQP